MGEYDYTWPPIWRRCYAVEMLTTVRKLEEIPVDEVVCGHQARVRGRSIKDMFAGKARGEQ